ncbi:MAG TPA: hypothetical protein VHO48_13270, partial [Anaerolineaceae bacterium]|nr:hypothetical protein [Anaerolineaceae bacterium]
MLMKYKGWLYALMVIAGAVAFYLGWFVWTGEAVKPLSGLGIGLGAALFSLGLGNLIGFFITSKAENQDIRRRKRIEVEDERN